MIAGVHCSSSCCYCCIQLLRIHRVTHEVSAGRPHRGSDDSGLAARVATLQSVLQKMTRTVHMHAPWNKIAHMANRTLLEFTSANIPTPSRANEFVAAGACCASAAHTAFSMQAVAVQCKRAWRPAQKRMGAGGTLAIADDTGLLQPQGACLRCMHGKQPPSVRLRESNSGKIAHARRTSSLCMHALRM